MHLCDNSDNGDSGDGVGLALLIVLLLLVFKSGIDMLIMLGPTDGV